MSDIPTRFPAVATDRVLILLAKFANTMLNLEMEFAHRLDEARLSRALTLLGDAEPVLGCRYVLDPHQPYWERVAPSGDRLIFTHDPAELAAFLTADLNAFAGPQYRACLLRESAGDRLLLKVAHNAADAGGIKHVSASLAEIYRRLGDDPRYLPRPNVEGSRDTWQIFRQIPRRALPKIYRNFLHNARINVNRLGAHSLRTNGVAGDPPAYEKRRFAPERVRRIAAIGRRYGATLNDLFIAAFLRTAARIGRYDGERQFRLATTVDLRRHYLPTGKAEGICNLSGFEYQNLDRNLGHDFFETLTMVAAATRARKANYLGLNDYIGVIPLLGILPPRWINGPIERLFHHGIRTYNVANVLTNMGPIEPEEVRYDEPPLDAWIHGPQALPPLLAAGLTGFAGSMTLSIGHLPTAENRALIASLLDGIHEILPA
ncbi:MAG: hypothetical protein GX444_10730 [Myxococcales bacterium]|nr:hypothetical protein [Myxococcales bacterium]